MSNLKIIGGAELLKVPQKKNATKSEGVKHLTK